MGKKETRIKRAKEKIQARKDGTGIKKKREKRKTLCCEKGKKEIRDEKGRKKIKSVCTKQGAHTICHSVSRLLVVVVVCSWRLRI